MQLLRRASCLAALVLLCCARGIASQATEDDIVVGGMPEGMMMDDQGKNYVMTDAGERYNVYRDKDTMKIFYMHAETREPQWNDPREPVAEPEAVVVAAAAAAPLDTIRVATIATVPVMLLLAGLAGRIYYLHTHHPELLFPTKDRKERRRTSGGKFKAQKARGKMSQDGKGGRSANS